MSVMRKFKESERRRRRTPHFPPPPPSYLMHTSSPICKRSHSLPDTSLQLSTASPQSTHGPYLTPSLFFLLFSYLKAN